ncbi:MAG TPA: hypothetical protein VK948_03325 [Aeromicrobium sp.]|nr:hypothetical protein [Aeromicrobium sp.]
MGDLLLVLGTVLFLFGLLVGFAVPKLKNPRMGLTSHLEGTQNGMFLMILGLLWPHLDLPHAWLVTTFWLAIYGTFANWFATFLAAAWGAGGAMMSLAAPNHTGTSGREGVIKLLLVTLSVAMVAATVLILIGLVRG